MVLYVLGYLYTGDRRRGGGCRVLRSGCEAASADSLRMRPHRGGRRSAAHRTARRIPAPQRCTAETGRRVNEVIRFSEMTKSREYS